MTEAVAVGLLLDYYRKKIEGLADRVESSEDINWREVMDYHQEVLGISEVAKVSDRVEAHHKRQTAFAKDFYARLSGFAEETEPVLSRLHNVNHFLLEQILAWVDGAGGIGKIAEDAFVVAFREEIDTRHDTLFFKTLQNYLKPLTLLEILKRKPRLCLNLEASSAYRPQDLFGRDHRTPAAMLSDNFESLLSERLLEVMPSIKEYIMSSSSDSQKRLGKYVIPAGIGLEWIKNGEEAEKGFHQSPPAIP